MEEYRLRVSDKEVLRIIFGTNKGEHLHNLHSSHNIVRVIKSGMRWVGHVACMGRTEMCIKILVRKLEGRDHL
jgi:uncharacterized membrane protein